MLQRQRILAPQIQTHREPVCPICGGTLSTMGGFKTPICQSCPQRKTEEINLSDLTKKNFVVIGETTSFAYDL